MVRLVERSLKSLLDWEQNSTVLQIFRRFTIKLAAACAIIETALIIYIHEREEELSQKFHD